MYVGVSYYGAFLLIMVCLWNPYFLDQSWLIIPDHALPMMLVLQFVHHLDRLVQKNAGFDPIITARFEVSMNGRKFRDMVDPNVDLSEIPKFEANYLWVKPFGER